MHDWILRKKKPFAKIERVQVLWPAHQDQTLQLVVLNSECEIRSIAGLSQDWLTFILSTL